MLILINSCFADFDFVPSVVCNWGDVCVFYIVPVCVRIFYRIKPGVPGAISGAAGGDGLFVFCDWNAEGVRNRVSIAIGAGVAEQGGDTVTRPGGQDASICNCSDCNCGGGADPARCCVANRIGVADVGLVRDEFNVHAQRR